MSSPIEQLLEDFDAQPAPGAPAPEAKEPHSDIGCTIICSKCAAFFRVPDIDFRANPTLREQYGYIAKVAEVNGWGHGVELVGAEARAIFTCPACLRRSPDALKRVLPRYNTKAQCGACGSTRIGTKHCKGLVSTCELGATRDHLHRFCRNCAWSWIEGRIDDPLTENLCTKS